MRRRAATLTAARALVAGRRAMRRRLQRRVARGVLGPTIMHILITLIVGLIVGGLAKLVMPGKDPGGVLITMLLGIAGAFIAGALGHSMGW